MSLCRNCNSKPSDHLHWHLKLKYLFHLNYMKSVESELYCPFRFLLMLQLYSVIHFHYKYLYQHLQYLPLRNINSVLYKCCSCIRRIETVWSRIIIKCFHINKSKTVPVTLMINFIFDRK